MNCPHCGRTITSTAGCFCHLERQPVGHISMPLRSVRVLSMPLMTEDVVTFTFNIPGPDGKSYLSMSFNAPKDQGAKYVKERFGLECEVQC